MAKNIYNEMNKLFPCPHNKNTECRMTEDCYSCETWKAHKVNLNNTGFYEVVNPLAKEAQKEWFL